MNKKIILIIVVAGLTIFGVYQFFKDEKPVFTVSEVSRGDVRQELWETGRVERGERVNLSFQSAARIEKIYVQASQTVERGEALVRLDTADLLLQLEGARSSLKLAELNLQKLLAGANPEEIKIAQAQKESTIILLNSAEDNLKNSYQSAVTVLNAAYPQLYNALDFVRELIKEYVVIYDEDGRKIMRARDEINSVEAKAKLDWEIARKAGADTQDIEMALLTMRSSLEASFNSLEVIREIVNKSVVYRDKVSAADKASLETLKSNINSALTNVITAQQTISSAKVNFETARTKLQEAENYLALVEGGARQVDIDLYQTQIRQARSQVQLYENQIAKATLSSPIKGQIMAVNKSEGEQVMALEPVISLLPAVPFEITSNIYEEDIVKIEIGAPVKISLPAFPGEIFKGRVIFVDEAEKIIDGVVHYEIKISFDQDPPEGIRTTMTADLIIQTGLKEDVLVVPREAIKRVNEKTIVEIFADNLIKEKEVEVGLRGDDLIEIISGLTEGEKIILR